jgi:hypothetical protein
MVPPPGPNAVEKEDIAALIDDVRDKVDTYPTVPRPATVDWILDVVMVPPPGPNAVEKEDK